MSKIICPPSPGGGERSGEGAVLPQSAQMRLTDKKYLCQVTLSVNADLPEVRGGAQRAEGMSSRYKSKLAEKVHEQGSAAGTYEAD